MNLGRLVKLSRIKYYQRSGGSKWQYLYAHGNPKRFRVWGTPTTDGVQLDITEPGNDRILLTEFTSVKPSGLPLGSTNADDQQLGGLDGEDVLIPIDAPAVRSNGGRCGGCTLPDCLFEPKKQGGVGT